MNKHILALILLACAACDDKSKSSTPASSSTAAASVVKSTASAKPEEPPAPWFVGAWQGSYDAQHYLIEMTKKQGGVREWKEDDGGVGEGAGKISLVVKEDGSITGDASGPLGDMIASGQVDEETFNVRLNAKEPGERSFQGFFVAKKKRDALSGRLQASTGDSRTVRDAPVELKKGAAGDTPKPAASAP